MDIQFWKLTKPTSEIAECINRWENDPVLIPLIRPNKGRDASEAREPVTVKDLEQRLEHQHTYLIYLAGQLVGEMDFQIDRKYLFKKEAGTAWVGIIIGEECARGK